MIYKTRTESTELRFMKSLNSRMNLSEKERQHYFNLLKGYEGELNFDLLTEKLQSDCLILNDLLLKMNNTSFQIDSLIIFPDTIYLFEVKNFEGDFYYESERLYKKPKIEVNNPLIQLNRSESLLRQLLQSLGFNIQIQASVVFINPEFTLYQTPLGIPFIFPTQIHRSLKKLDKISSKLNQKHKMLADKLISLHIEDSPYTLIPDYHYDQLQKGVVCDGCGSFSISVMGPKCICQKCGHVELVDAAVIRSVSEFKMLFPDEKITTNGVHDWCGVVESKKSIRRILGENFNKIGVRQWSYYE